MPTENYVQANGVTLCWFEWGEAFKPGGTILLVHATGFHARCWDETVARLGDRHVIAVDMRGHGRSEKKPPFHWDTFGDDLTAFVVALDLSNIVGAGHSMGGHSLTQTVAREQSRFKSIVLVDPVILSPLAYEQFDGLIDPTLHPVSRRRNQFDSVGALIANLEGRGSFALWQPPVLRDYCTYGLLPNPEGDGLVLACPPLVEATIYTGSASTDIHHLLGDITLPVGVLRAAPRDADQTQMDFSKSPTWPELASRFPNGKDIYLPGLTHFIPMQAPEVVAEHILAYAQ